MHYSYVLKGVCNLRECFQKLDVYLEEGKRA